MPANWICCQIGAREHYIVPRALAKQRALQCLVTDIWARPKSFFAAFKRGLRQRYHPQLGDAHVHASNLKNLAFEATARLGRASGWQLMRQRNLRFQQQALARISSDAKLQGNQKFTVFAYSYAAKRLFEYAQQQGWRTILGQIDAGPLHARTLASLNEKHLTWCDQPSAAPVEYWHDWRDECALADRIVVNSEWSRQALIEAGIDRAKIDLVQLAFDQPVKRQQFVRHYPAAFCAQRPMRVLFLGQINLAKGIVPLLEAARLLADAPIEFWLVGAVQVVVPPALTALRQVKWFGAAPRHEVDRYYRQADVFILPTLSDGFGLTQLEAQSWQLPVIASRFCGAVVRDGVNGISLDEVSGAAIATVLGDLLRYPDRLRDLAAHAGIDDRFTIDSLATSLLRL
jgi:glycosyltransferase involved in cell wall biosynthesis